MIVTTPMAEIGCGSGWANRLPRRFTARTANLQELLRAERRSTATLHDRERAETDLKRFFSTENKPALDRFLQIMEATEDELLLAISRGFLNREALSGAAWYRLAAAVLSSDFIAECDRNIHGASGLLKPLYPFLNWADARISEWRERYHAEWDLLRPALLQQLSGYLARFAYKAFVLEANILRLRTATGREADGCSVVEQFAQATIDRRRYLQRLYLSYPGLTRLMAATALDWRRNTENLLARLGADAGAIEKNVLREPIGTLQEIVDTFSDPHNGGQRVMVLRFSSGQRVVYKPRSVQIDLSYQKILAWLNKSGFSPKMRALAMVPGNGYGWVEFVDDAPLSQPGDAPEFYRRHGVHLALLYAMKGTDLHFENIIASGSEPVLIDLETLMHGQRRSVVDADQRSSADKLLSNSVFGCGLLPGWTDGNPLGPSPDLSGIGTLAGQFYQYKGDVIQRGDDGTIRIVRERIAVGERPNRPLLDGKRVHPVLFRDEVIQGFECCYRFLQKNRAELMKHPGPITEALQAEIRHVPLPTAIYATLMQRASHPDFLTRSVYRELTFAVLVRSDTDAPSFRMLQSELQALFDGDVPKFTTQSDSTSLFDARGFEITDILHEPAATTVRERIARLDEDNLRVQKEIIRLSIATLCRPNDPGAELAPPYAVPDDAADEGEILEEVRQIADAICDRAIANDDKIDWLGLLQGDHERTTLSSVGLDLYDGVAGIGLFLAAAGRRLKHDRFLSAAHSCARAASEELNRARRFLGGGFTGPSGTGYGLAHIAVTLDQPEWLDQVVETACDLSIDVDEDRVFDIIGGSAGMCAVLAALYRFSGEARLLIPAVQAAEHLLAQRIDCDTGFGWPSRNESVPLAGFAHGAGGIGWALAHVGHLTKQEQFEFAAKRAFAYERSLYSASNRGWPDLRSGTRKESGNAYPIAWCHGGPGIGLARASLPGACIGEAERMDIANAVGPMLASGLSSTDCLCHGEFGNIELLLAAAGPLGEDLVALARRRATGAIRRRRAVGSWRCGTVPNEATPGLLTGLAGIGYGMLRCYFPSETPSILCLEPPVATAHRGRTVLRGSSRGSSAVCDL